MLFVSHLLLIAVVIAGMSYSRYHSEFNVRISQQVSTAKNSYTALMTLLSSSVAGRNYANLMMPTTRSTIFGIEDLVFMQVSGVSDYESKPISVRYLPKNNQIWRTDIEPQELLKLESTLAQLLENKSNTADDNVIRHKKLDYLINKSGEDIDTLRQSIALNREYQLEWTQPSEFENGYALDGDHGVLHILLPLKNNNGGNVWAVFDASEIESLRFELIKDLMLEALAAIAISVVLISAITAWLVSPLKSLAKSMRQDIQRIDPIVFKESKRNDEIGELTRAYTSLIVKINNQLRVLQKLSDTDPLTGLASRHKYNRLAKPFALNSLQNGQYVSMSVCDIDQFKAYNDAFGHIDGDNALCTIASAIEASVAPNGEVFRFGGEEFVVLAKANSPAALQAVAEAINLAVFATKIHHPGNTPYGVVTLSIGSVVLSPEQLNSVSTHMDEVLEDCFSIADKQLYECKHQGRNQVIVEAYPHDPITDSVA